MAQQAFLVLTPLAAEPLHGHGIVQAVHLLSDGLVEPDREEIHQGRTRRYHRTTDAGMGRLLAEARRRAHVASVALERGHAAGRTPTPAATTWHPTEPFTHMSRQVA